MADVAKASILRCMYSLSICGTKIKGSPASGKMNKQPKEEGQQSTNRAQRSLFCPSASCFLRLRFFDLLHSPIRPHIASNVDCHCQCKSLTSYLHARSESTIRIFLPHDSCRKPGTFNLLRPSQSPSPSQVNVDAYRQPRTPNTCIIIECTKASFVEPL
ncbi:hypothetical protein BD289DRAFT_255125 [Coniella lustricola]|uniref:Uncharacterized protein n=1 Tax=Coniella lustricola TaxID=2025994 RepID=A0A2T3AKT7_9PEZI|nr:hypothetical protein BD289DRAFT_255125 [Coniella lustricola]